MNIEKSDYTIVAQYLVKELVADITGENEEWLFGKKPSENVMIGMIGSDVQEASIIKGEDVDNQQFKSIPSIGMRFRIPKTIDQVSFSIKGKLFYRMIPSYEDEVRFLTEKYSKSTNGAIRTTEELKKHFTSLEEVAPESVPKESLVLVYKSINLESLGTYELKLNSLAESLKAVNSKISADISHRVDSIRDVSIAGKDISRPITTLLDKGMFKSVLESSVVNIIPNWNISIYADVEDYESYREVIIQLVNSTERIKQTLSYETAIFNGGIKVTSIEGFIPIAIDSLKHYYADKPTMPAIGNNCAIIQSSSSELETENFPCYEQKRVVTIDKYNQYIEFQKLIEAPVPNLTYIYEEMLKRLDIYRNELDKAKYEKSDLYIHKFESEINDFEREIKRFKSGIHLILNKSDVYHAFQLMNRTFALNKKYKGWRMFQIVFIVSELMDMINCEYEGTPGFVCNDINNVDLIYFSTGGGKTETFLGCCVFSGFFDRIRGKENGVSAIIKYPLRLLAAQQLDRVLALTINANKIKEEYKIPGEEFSVGFFTGSKNTPNRIDDKKKLDIESMTQENRNALYRQIDICPICKSSMDIWFNEDAWQLRHRCTNPTCNFEPPIYIVDEEIYRYSPTFIISTIDKMANIGTSLGFKALFGQVTNRCRKHGFVLYGNRCSIPGCHCEIEYDIERKDPIPTLSIQDELHLVNQSLGTFDSHYESLIQYYCANLVSKGQRKLIKYIGATATISNYDEHIRNLYGKDAKRFPTTVRKENFYSETDPEDICRIILGTALYGGSITDNLQKMITLMRVIVSQWMQKVHTKLQLLRQSGFKGDENALVEVLQNYLIAIVYNNSKSDAGTIRAILENQGSNTLLSENVPNFDIAEITGDIEFKTIKNVMHDIEAIEDKFDTHNVIIATSAISHGVDEDCFNQIFFFGMPNQTSEYIQAYSRVGRAHTGVVFDVFRIVRDRDKSFLKNFYNFHEYKELLIDPVPINRYAKNAIYCTLPGVVAALLYQHYVKARSAIKVTQAIQKGTLTLEMLQTDVGTIYDCLNQNSQLYREIIQAELKLYFSAFQCNTNRNISIADLIKQAGSKHKAPMQNLRDVDVSLEIKLTGD